MFCRSLAESAGHFWQPTDFENLANPDFENLKHLQNPGHLTLTELSVYFTHHINPKVSELWIQNP